MPNGNRRFVSALLRHLCLVITFLCLGHFTSTAQDTIMTAKLQAYQGDTTLKHTMHHDPVIKPVVTHYDLYICPKCSYTCPNPVEPFTCPNDRNTLIGQGEYYCPKCFNTSNTSGNCSKCGATLILMKGPDIQIPLNNTH